jgi:hypothetical protein
MEGQELNVIVHYPRKSENVHALQVRVATVHTRAIMQYLEKLTCPKEQKLQLLKEIEEALRGIQ